MPPEWRPHERTWMCFPTNNYVGGDRSGSAEAWSAVANTIARYEPVVMIADVGASEGARRFLNGTVEIIEFPIDDAWLRDSGPTFVHHADGRLGSVEWVFNGWGAQEWASWEYDAKVGAQISEWSGAVSIRSHITNEGGGFHVDGSGTAMLTETVQLDPNRNPGLERHHIEAEMSSLLGVERFIWFPRGLTADYKTFGTRGHVDLLAAFIGSGQCVAHLQPEVGHPDYHVSRENISRLRSGGIEVLPISAPETGKGSGQIVDWSYINFYVGNGFVLMCTFGDPRQDAAAAETLRDAFPGRVVEAVDGRPLFEYGGGVHCITLQQPTTDAPVGGAVT
jgi:agmatine deiminase